MFVRRLVWCPLRLFGWWLTRPLVCGFFTGGGWDSAVGKADGSNIRGGVRVDDMLEASGEPSVEELRKFLVDPVSDDTAREDEREKPTTLEHMKLLRYYLDRKVDTLQKGATAMNERLDEIVKWISQQGCQGGRRVSPRKVVKDQMICSDGDTSTVGILMCAKRNGCWRR